MVRWSPLGAVLGAAFVLRVALALSGGAIFWGDEGHRWPASVQLYDAIRSHGDWAEAASVPFRYIHFGVGFLVPGLPAVWIAKTLPAWLTEPQALYATVALYAGLASTAVLALLALIAHRLGASRREVVAGTALAGCCVALTYWSRFYQPYDYALALCLGAVAAALREEVHWREGRGAWIGALAMAALLTHYGVAQVLVLVGAAMLWRHGRNVGMFAGAVAGALLVYLPVHVLMVAQGKPWWWLALYTLVRPPQGDVATGWWMPFVYFWETDHVLALAWLAALPSAWRRVWARPVVVAFGLLYAEMALFSTGVGALALTGRYVRSLALPLSLLLGAQLVRSAGASRLRAAAMVIAVVLTAIGNFHPLFAQVFPCRAEEAWRAEVGDLRCAFTIAGPATGRADPVTPYVAVNTCAWLYPVLGLRQDVPAGRTVHEHLHPLAYRPYQFELFTAAERATLRAADLRVRLLDTSP